MLALFTWFTTTKLGREVGLALIILAVLAGVYARGHAAGFRSGHTAGGKETFDQLRGDMDAERTKTTQLLATYDVQIKAKDTAIAAQQSVIDTQHQQLTLLNQQQAVIRQQISQLTDAQVILDLAGRLKLRATSDTTPSLYPQEVRRADEIVGDYSVVTQKVDTLQKTVDAQGVQVKDLNDKVSLTDQKFQAAMGYIIEADQRFKNAYNVFESLNGRPWYVKVFTFGIVRNKKITKLTPIIPPVYPQILK